MFKNAVIAVLAAGLIATGAFIFARTPQEQPLGASGSSFSPLVEFFGGFMVSDNYATTTAGNATLSAKETVGYSTMSLYPNIGSITLTTAASTSLNALLPKPGDMKRICYYNATTTAGINITFAAGTGVDLESASTTAQVAGTSGLVLGPDNSLCIEYARKSSASATAANRNDYTGRVYRFIDAD